MTKTILVTGAARGIGAELTRLLGSRGDAVIALGRGSSALDDHPGRVIRADLSEPEGLAAAVADIDRLDVLVHCAGIAHAGPVERTGVDSWRDHLTVNVAAPAELTRALLPALRTARGLVVFVNSGAGLSASPMFAAYAASKHALKALADALRAEERDAGVRVSTIYPGLVDTDMQRELRSELGALDSYDPDRTMRAATVAAAIVGMIDLPSDAVVTDLRMTPPNGVPHPTTAPPKG